MKLPGAASGESTCRNRVLGQWSLQVDTPIGTKTTTLTLDPAPQGSQGWMLDLFGRRLDLADIEFGQDQLTWRLSVLDPVPLTLQFFASIEGDQMHGRVQWAFADMSFRGQRVVAGASS